MRDKLNKGNFVIFWVFGYEHNNCHHQRQFYQITILQLIFAALLANKTKKKLAVIEIIWNDASFTVIKN